jgi:hypothetical protein
VGRRRLGRHRGHGDAVRPAAVPGLPRLHHEHGLAASTDAGATSLVRRPPPAAAAVLVWLGVVVGMVVIGAVLALLSLSLGRVLSVILPVIDLVIIALGLLLIAGRNPFARIPQPRATRSAAGVRTSARSCTGCSSPPSPCPARARS